MNAGQPTNARQRAVEEPIEGGGGFIPHILKRRRRCDDAGPIEPGLQRLKVLERPGEQASADQQHNRQRELGDDNQLADPAGFDGDRRALDKYRSHIDAARLLAAEEADALRRELVAPVVTVMRSDVIFVEPDTDVKDVVELLIENKIGAVPVIRPDTREVVGIVSYIDALRALRDLLERE